MRAPLLIGNRFRIVTPGTEPGPDGRIDLVLEMGAFGSGEHETTSSCLELLAAIDGIAGARVLDLGSGSGVLAIAALKLGAAHAVCVDPDPAAIATATHNCELNRVSDRASHVTGTLAECPPGSFDLILANLYPDVLIEEAPALATRTSAGATVVLSGILWQDNYSIRRHYIELGFSEIRNRFLAEYTTIHLRATKD